MDSIKNEMLEYRVIHKSEDEIPPKREFAINGRTYSVYLSSTDEKETMQYLSELALETLNKISQEGNGE
jgi:hypothetical protein